MTQFKALPELMIEPGQVDGLYRIATKSGDVIIAGGFRCAEDAQRLVDCWNACRKLYAPAAHIQATEEYTARLENLRREAWARAERLEAEVNQLRADPGVAALSLAEGAAILAERETAA
jgi:hypothetical protein